jgi:hypothetical protein
MIASAGTLVQNGKALTVLIAVRPFKAPFSFLRLS